MGPLPQFEAQRVRRSASDANAPYVDTAQVVKGSESERRREGSQPGRVRWTPATLPPFGWQGQRGAAGRGSSGHTAPTGGGQPGWVFARRASSVAREGAAALQAAFWRHVRLGTLWQILGRFPRRSRIRVAELNDMRADVFYDALMTVL